MWLNPLHVWYNQTLRPAASDLGLQFAQTLCPNTKSKYGKSHTQTFHAVYHQHGYACDIANNLLVHFIPLGSPFWLALERPILR